MVSVSSRVRSAMCKQKSPAPRCGRTRSALLNSYELVVTKYHRESCAGCGQTDSGIEMRSNQSSHFLLFAVLTSGTSTLCSPRYNQESHRSRLETRPCRIKFGRPWNSRIGPGVRDTRNCSRGDSTNFVSNVHFAEHINTMYILCMLVSGRSRDAS